MLKWPKEEREKWLEGVVKELKDFAKRAVWKIMKMHDVPDGRRLIGTKWVFKKKRDGRYRSRLVALGYTQIPGIDYTDNFSAVVSEIGLRICLILWIVLSLEVWKVDVETAFLEGDLKEEEYAYLKCPDGMTLNEDECLRVEKGMYGLTQVARVFWQKMTIILVKMGFKVFECDQCIFFKQGKENILIILLYVDDALIFGKKTGYIRNNRFN